MIIVQCETETRKFDFDRLYEDLCDMMDEGLILLPAHCHIVRIYPEKDTVLKLVSKERD